MKDASALVKEVNTAKFDASVDLHIRLGVDPKKADQAIRGTVTLPHGTGKTKRVLVLCGPDQEAAAKGAGRAGRRRSARLHRRRDDRPECLHRGPARDARRGRVSDCDGVVHPSPAGRGTQRWLT